MSIPTRQSRSIAGTYYFDLHDNGEVLKDTIGFECKNFPEVRHHAMSILAEIASNEKHDVDIVRLTVVVRRASDAAVYRSTLTIDGERLGRDEDQKPQGEADGERTS